MSAGRGSNKEFQPALFLTAYAEMKQEILWKTVCPLGGAYCKAFGFFSYTVELRKVPDWP